MPYPMSKTPTRLSETPLILEDPVSKADARKQRAMISDPKAFDQSDPMLQSRKQFLRQIEKG